MFSELNSSNLSSCSALMTGFYLYKIATGGNHIPTKADWFDPRIFYKANTKRCVEITEMQILLLQDFRFLNKDVLLYILLASLVVVPEKKILLLFEYETKTVSQQNRFCFHNFFIFFFFLVLETDANMRK